MHRWCRGCTAGGAVCEARGRATEGGWKGERERGAEREREGGEGVCERVRNFILYDRF